MEEQDCLYLRGRRDGSDLWLPAESLVTLFTLQYCRNPAVNVVVVENHPSTSKLASPENVFGSEVISEVCVEDEYWFPVDMNCICFDIQVKKEEDCPNGVARCMLPAVVRAGEPWCIAGMCSSLRFMLRQTSKIYPEHYCQNLLGFRGSCLQACAEVSVWTKFCEVEIINTLKSVFCGHYINNNVIRLPKEIVRYEHHMRHPPIMHNALKRKQEYIKQTVLDKSERQQLCQKKLAELPQMEHKFAEGLDMTLADILLYASFHIIFSKIRKHSLPLEDTFPLVTKWYKLISDNEYVKSALTLLEKSISYMLIDVNVRTDYNLVVPEVPYESIYKSDPDRYKPRWRAYTHQNEIDRVLQVLGMADIRPSYDAHPSNAVSLAWSSFPAAVNPEEGELPLSRLERKCQQLENIVSAVQFVAKDGDVIVDFCAGGGHVGIVLAYCLPQCKILLVENKEASLLRAKKRVEALEMKNVEFLQCNLDYFQGHFDVGVSLHACGVATDLVMQKCLDIGAAFVCSPCCYGGVQANHILGYPRSLSYRNLPLSLSDYLILGHAADQTHDESNPKTEQGKICMRLIDHDRLMLAREKGYSAKLVLMIPKMCSPKNHLLVGMLNP